MPWNKKLCFLCIYTLKRDKDIEKLKQLPKYVFLPLPVSKNGWIILSDDISDQHPCKHVTSIDFNESTNLQYTWFSKFINLDVKFYNSSATGIFIYSAKVNILCSMCFSSLLQKYIFLPTNILHSDFEGGFFLFLSQSDWERLWCVHHYWFNRHHHLWISCFYSLRNWTFRYGHDILT